jgi:hypothetical protein
MQLASGNALISPAQAMSIANDQSGRNFQNLAQTARQQAVARGNGPGDIVGNGQGNGTLADFADQALQQQAQASQQALLGQQQLGLQQQAQGLNTALGAGQQQQGLELGGLGAIGNLTGQQTGQLGLGGNLLNSAAQLGNNGASFYNSLLGLQQGNMQQGFNAGAQNVGLQQGLMQQAIQDLMTGQNNSNNAGNALAQLYLQNQGQLASGIGQGLNTNLSALGQLGTQGGNWLSGANSALGTYGNTGDSVSKLLQQPNQWSVLLNNFGGSAQGGGGSNAVGAGLAGLGAGIGSTLGKIILGRGQGNPNFTYDPTGGLGGYGGISGGGSGGYGGIGSGGGDPFGGFFNSPYFQDPSYGGYGGGGYNMADYYRGGGYGNNGMADMSF